MGWVLTEDEIERYEKGLISVKELSDWHTKDVRYELKQRSKGGGRKCGVRDALILALVENGEGVPTIAKRFSLRITRVNEILREQGGGVGKCVSPNVERILALWDSGYSIGQIAKEVRGNVKHTLRTHRGIDC